MRKRDNIPAFFKDEIMAELPRDVRLLAQGLDCLADREGRLEDRPRWIKAEVFPYDDDVNGDQVNQWLEALASKGFILRYEAAGKRYIEITGFTEKQNIHPKEKPSIIPPPISENAGIHCTPRVPAELNDLPFNSTEEPERKFFAAKFNEILPIPSSTSGSSCTSGNGDDDSPSGESFPAGKKKGPSFSPQAKALVAEFKEILQQEGVSTFGKDWNLTSYAVCDSMLKSGLTAERISQGARWLAIEWDLKQQVTHFKHVQKNFPHFERRHSESSKPKTLAERVQTYEWVLHQETKRVYRVADLEFLPRDVSSKRFQDVFRTEDGDDLDPRMLKSCEPPSELVAV